MGTDSLIVHGAREHNLRNVTLELPRDRLIVFTGLSGSGKSSLAFDTIYAEGQRRYVESLSSYARQFLGQMEKPDVDFIEGLSPAISIDQKSTSRNPRSTVGTITEVSDYLRVLFARVGHPHCYNCGRPIGRQTPEQIVDQVMELPEGTRFQVLAPVVRGRKGEYGKLLDELARKGFPRARIDGEVRELSEPIRLAKNYKHTIEVVVDRLVAKRDIRRRVADSIETALELAEGVASIAVHHPRGPRGDPDLLAEPRVHVLRALVRRDGAAELLVQLAVRRVPHVRRPRHPARGRPRAGRPRPRPVRQRGRARAVGVRHARVLVPGPRGRRRGARHRPRRAVAQAVEEAARHPALRADESIHVRYKNRYSRQRSYWTTYEGVIPNIERRHAETDSDTARDKLEQFMREIPCRACKGARLRPETLAVTLGDLNIARTDGRCRSATRSRSSTRMDLTEREAMIAERLVKEIRARLGFLVDVGLDYLTLGRGGGHARGRRGAAHPARDPDRQRPGGRAVHPRRAVDRPAPA